jgi:endonuclease YncB( thermonuclease family)
MTAGRAGRHTVKNSILLTPIATALGTIFFAVSGARERSTISGPARVVDGDTVVVAGTTVRLKGVDAAELGTARGENAHRAMIVLVTSELPVA